MTESFSMRWLRLRETADASARAARIHETARAWASARDGLNIVDLGGGAGANLRFLAPKLPGPQRWRLVDHDTALLAAARAQAGGVTDADERRVGVELSRADLSATQEPALAGVDLVTGSALLDLVSRTWLERLAARARDAGAAALFALSYDGAAHWTPRDPADEWVRDAVNRHQRRDKGFGPALGPTGAAVTAQAFRSQGYRVTVEPSPWRLQDDASELQTALVAGWYRAATQQRPTETDPFKRWAQRRYEQLQAGRLQVTVGHLDLFAEPPA